MGATNTQTIMEHLHRSMWVTVRQLSIITGIHESNVSKSLRRSTTSLS